MDKRLKTLTEQIGEFLKWQIILHYCFLTYLPKYTKRKQKQKVEILQRYDTQSLRMLLKASFDPTKEWVIPTGDVPFTPNDAPEGTEHTVLAQETKNYGTLLKVVITKLNNHKKKICLYKYVRHYVNQRQNY